MSGKTKRNQQASTRAERLRMAFGSVRSHSSSALRFASRRNTVLSGLVLAIPMAALGATAWPPALGETSFAHDDSTYRDGD